jgi:ribosomal protein S18 acetylase RimI-like enzyme
MTAGPSCFRDFVRGDDPKAVRVITESTGFFYPEEVDTAVELVEERLAKGPKSGYHFLFAEAEAGQESAEMPRRCEGVRGNTVVLGYSCFGPIACTKASFDLYWIVVARDSRGRGIGTRLLEESERAIDSMGGKRIYVETSSRTLYEPTRAFYRARGYMEAAVLEDFYGPGDSKVVYCKAI